MTLLRIEAFVREQEQRCIVSGLEQLHEALQAVMPITPHSIQVNFNGFGTPIPNSPSPNIVILSLLPEMYVRNQHVLETKNRLKSYIEQGQSLGASVLICNIFRHIDAGELSETKPYLVERIRRLNLMAIGLSYESGVGIVDIDRAMAHLGGRNLQSDFLLSGDSAADVVGHALAWSLLSFGLDTVIDPTNQEKAKITLGDLRKVPEILRIRQARRSQQAISHA